MHKRSKLITLISALTMGVVLITVLILVLVANGIISVTTSKLVLTSESLTAPYSGTALKAPQWTLKEGTLKEGHTMTVNVSGEQTNVGTSENYISVTIKDANGVDVTTDYEVSFIPGTLTVTPRQITVIAASADKMYDGDPLTSDKFEIDPLIGLVAGHTVHAEVEGEQTEIGESDNLITSLYITDADGRDVTFNYNVSTARGKLTVNGYDDIVISTETSEAFYNGLPLTNRNWRLDDGELEEGDTISVNVVGTQTDVGSCKNDFYVNIFDKYGNDVSYKYRIIKNAGTLTVKPQCITITTEDAQKIYDGTPLTNPNYEATKLYYKDAVLQVSVIGSQTEVGKSPNAVGSYIILDPDNNDITRNYEIIVKEGELFVAASDDGFKNKLTITTFDAQKTYDGDPLTEPGYLIDGDVKDGHTVIVTNTGSQTTVGSSKNFATAIVIDHEGNTVNDQYNIVYKEGTLTVTKQKITISSDGATKFYDGSPLTNRLYTVSPATLTYKFNIEVEITGSQTEVGTSDNTISRYRITDTYERDVTSNFEVTLIEGTLEVLLPEAAATTELSFMSESDEKIYDGTALTNDKCLLISGELADGHRPVFEVYGYRVDVGTSENDFSVRIVDRDGNDVSDQYSIRTYPGTLTVTKRDVTVKANSAQKIYDGYPLTENAFSVSPNYLIDNGFYFEVIIYGSQTAVGSSDNAIVSCNIYSPDGYYANDNFNITYENGTLTVFEQELNRTLVYQSGSSEKQYDAEPLYNQNWERISGDLAAGHREIVTLEKYITNVGTEENTIVVKIVDEFGYDVSAEYEIQYEPGTLTVYPVTVTIKAGSSEKFYDGAPLTDKNGFSITPSYAIPAGATVIVENIGSQTEVGTSENVVSYWKILDKNNNDASKNFIVTLECGYLTVNSLELTIIAEDAEKQFDGTPLTNPYYSFDPYTVFPEGFTFDIVVSGSVTYPGSSENVVVSYAFYNQNGEDISHNLIIHTQNGTLTVLPAEITLTANSSTKYYDGTPLTDDGFQYDVIIPDGATVKADVFGEQTEIGSSDNVISSFSIYDAEGNDITCYYIPTYENGTLTVEIAPLHLCAKSDSKYYDGTPLINDGYFIKSGDRYIPEDAQLVISVSGEQTEVGSSDNVITSFEIFDAYGNNITDHYDVTTEEGTLTVEKIRIVIEAASAYKRYDGDPLTDPSFTVRNENNLPAGAYVVAIVDGSQTEIGSSDNVITDWAVYDADGNNISDYVDARLVNGKLVVDKIVIDIYAASDEKYYDGTPLINGTYTLEGTENLPPLAEVIAIVEGEQTEIGSSQNVVTSWVVYDAAGNDITDFCDVKTHSGYLEVKKIPLKITANSDFKFYDGTPLTNDTYNVDGQEYLPEGAYVIAIIEGEQTEVGSSDNVITSWAVYDAYNNDISEYCDVETLDGLLTVERIKITIVAQSDEKIYDGTPLTNEFYYVIPDTPLPEGAYAIAVVEGEQTLIGSSPNTVTSWVIYDAEGNDITDFCEVSTEDGSLTVDKIPVTIIAESDEKYYDGEPLMNSRYHVESQGYLPEASDVRATVYGEQTELGSSANTVTSWTIYDEFGNDITDLCDVTTLDGQLTVNKIPLTITANSAEKKYDGSPLVDSGFITDNTYLPEGAYVTATVEGSQTVIGSSDNVVTSWAVYDAYDNDISDYIDITLVNGTLEVTQPTLIIIASNASKYYDGTPLTSNEFTLQNDYILPEGAYVEVVIEGEQTVVGSSVNAIVGYTVRDKDGTDITKRYSTETVNGSLTVSPAQLEISPDSAEKVFDGTPLTKDTYTYKVVEGALPEGATVFAETKGSQTEVGTSFNDVGSWKVLDVSGNDITKYFEMHCNYGSLKVTKPKISIYANSDSKYYDGTPLENSGYHLGDGIKLPEGVTLEVVVVGSQTAVGSSANVIQSYRVFFNGEDIADDFDISTFDGTLTVKAPDDEGNEERVYFTLTSDTTGTIYLKMESYGDYMRTGMCAWAHQTPYGKYMSGNISAGYLTSLALEDVSSTVANLKVVPEPGVTLSNMMPYYTLPGGTSFTMSETAVSGYINGEMTAQFIFSSSLNGASLPAEYRAYEEEYRNYVYANYTDLDDETLLFMKQLIAKNGWDKSNPYIINLVANYVKGAAKYDLEYNPALDYSSNIAIEFLTVYGKGVCRHYANTATAIYRALGIPARYTEGFKVDAQAGVPQKVSAGHAWVEVYIDGIGWMPVEVTGSIESDDDDGNGTGTPTFKLKPAPTYAQYSEDSSEVIYPVQSLSGDIQKLLRAIEATLGEKVTCSATVNGSRRLNQPGKTVTSIVDIRFYNSKDEDITDYVYANFVIERQNGILQVYYDIMTFGSDSHEKDYDGTPLLNSNDDCYYISGSLRPGHRYTIQANGSITDVGTNSSSFKVTIYDETGADVTDCYRLKNSYGQLVIKPISITFEAGSASKKYDGTALTCNTLIYDPTALLNGDYVSSYVIEGSATKPLSQCDNIIKEIVIRDRNGIDVTKNYSCTFIAGTLKITLS